MANSNPGRPRNTGSKRSGRIIIHDDIYGGGGITVEARDYGAESQGEIVFGQPGSKIIRADFRITPVQSRGAAEKVSGSGVKKERAPNSMSGAQ